MDQFLLRRAIERLRDGLFDPVAVNLLTVEENRIRSIFSKGLKALENGKSNHLCLLGSYGQGKSHTINHLRDSALSLGFATSVVQLDLREIPFHQFPIVFQSIMKQLTLPDGKTFTQAWKQWAEKDSLDQFHTMPHRFKMILKAMLCRVKRLSSKEILLKKHRNYRPKEYGYWLEKALMGHNIPVQRLKSVFNYREVEGYREESLVCRGNGPYFQMVQSLGEVLKEMGYKGLLLFFDEAESIAQGRLTQRAKSYHLLDQFFQGSGDVYPLFAFTDDFFEKSRHESYDDERNIFSKNYSEAWQDLTIFRLQDLSSRGWESLLERLIQLYSQAYQIKLPIKMKEVLQALLKQIDVHETRFKLKALINKLDIETQ